MIPVMLSIAGSDCSAGAGLQADLKTGFVLGCYPLTVVTCVVSEIPGHVAGIVPLEPDFVASQLAECLCAFPVAAVKTGMLYTPEILSAVAKLLPEGIPLVVDPVMVATAGDPLMLDETLCAYREILFPRATLITPNLDELARLTGVLKPCSLQEMEEAVRDLSRKTGCRPLAKGGDLPGDICTDIYCESAECLRHFSHPRTKGIPTHGTGCTLSAAVAAFLARGLPLSHAINRALKYTARSIALSHRWNTTTFALNHGVQETTSNSVPVP